MNYAELNQQAAEVVRWNTIAQNGVEDLSEDKLVRQLSYVLEECKETVEASLAFDSRELADGVADVFVTLTYAMRILLQGRSVQYMPHVVPDVSEHIPEAAYSAVGQIGVSLFHMCKRVSMALEESEALDNERVAGDLFNQFNLMLAFYEQYFKHCPSVVIRAVLDSNWSKYVAVSDATTPEWIAQEAAWVETTYNVKDVVGTVIDGYIVFRDDGGKGKIRKPSSYKDPII